MRVLVVTNMHPAPDQPWRGRFVSEQVEDLRLLGMEVDVLSFDGRGDRRAYGRTARTVRASVQRRSYDVVHAHYGLTGAVALAQQRRPVVTTFHGSDVVVPWQKLISMVVARLTTPIFVAESQRHALRLTHGEVIPAAVDAEIFAPRDRFEARRALGWDVQQSYVLFPASRSNRVKRADVFDAAIAIARRQLPDLVGMSLDGLAREEVALAMNAADVVLLPSDSEGSPVSVREALACETPVVATPVGDLGEVLAGLPASGTAPQEPQALAQLVIGAVGVNRSGALRQRALQFARERTAERIADVYRRVVEASEPSVHSRT